MYSSRRNKGWQWLSPTVRSVLLHCDSFTALQFYYLCFLQIHMTWQHKINSINPYVCRCAIKSIRTTGWRSGQFTPGMPEVKYASLHAAVEPAVLSSDMTASIHSTAVCWEIKYSVVCCEGKSNCSSGICAEPHVWSQCQCVPALMQLYNVFQSELFNYFVD